jgi:hypothetical protein
MLKITYEICNTSIKEKIDVPEKSTVQYMIDMLSVKYNHHECKIVNCGLTLDNKSYLIDGEYYTVISPSVQFFLELTKNTIIHDFHLYSLGICSIQIAREYEKICHSKYPIYKPKETFIQQIVKIIRETTDGYSIKLFTPYQINHGSGPTCPSIYAFLKKNETKELLPYYCEHPFIEKNIYDGIVDARDITTPFNWKSIDPENCCICLDELANMCHYGDNHHQVCCRKCSQNLKNCPICQIPITNWIQVRYL